MLTDDIVRIVKEDLNLFIRYEVQGLNMFTVNSTLNDINNTNDMPYLKFLLSMMRDYQVIVLIGAPGLRNGIVDKFEKGFTLENLIGFEKNCKNVSVCLCDGNFLDSIECLNEYGEGVLFECNPIDSALLLKLFGVFSYYSALGFLLYEKEKQGFKIAEEIFAKEISKTETIEKILVEANFFITTSHDGYFLEIFTKSLDVEKEIFSAKAIAQNYIESSIWYKKNEANLSWSELEGTYVVKGEN